jgi:hypothetical protein
VSEAGIKFISFKESLMGIWSLKLTGAPLGIYILKTFKYILKGRMKYGKTSCKREEH